MAAGRRDGVEVRVKLCFETDRLQFDPLSLDDLDLTVE